MKDIPPGIAPPQFYELEKCPVRLNLGRLCNKWSLLILIHLHFGSHRFSELLGALPDISQRMLTQNLRMLEDCNMVSRKVTASIPPRVDYALTDVGKSFLKPLLRMMQWELQNRKALTVNSASGHVKAA